MGPTRQLTDDELMTVADDPVLKAKLTPEETGRLSQMRSGGAKKRTWTDTAVDALPAIGGTVGGIVGGLGGTVLGMAVGGVPGAMGGAALGGGGGEAAKQLINRARGADAPNSRTEAAGDIALQGGVQGALEGAGAVVGPAMVKGGQAVYRGYLKPSLSVKNLPKAEEIVRTAINEGLAMTKGGAAKADKVIGQLRTQVDNILANMPGEVDLHVVADKLRSWATKVYDRPGRAPSDLEAAMGVADRIDNHPSMIPTPPAAPVDKVGLTAANQVKRDMQSGASSAFGVKSGAEKSAEKEGSHLLRRDVEQEVLKQGGTDVGPINARESSLIETARAIVHGAGRDANNQKLYGTRALVGAAVGGGASYKKNGNPYEAAGWGLALAATMDPAVATRIAIYAGQLGAKMPGQAPAAVARAAYQAFSEAQK